MIKNETGFPDRESFIRSIAEAGAIPLNGAEMAARLAGGFETVPKTPGPSLTEQLQDALPTPAPPMRGHFKEAADPGKSQNRAPHTGFDPLIRKP